MILQFIFPLLDHNQDVPTELPIHSLFDEVKR